MTETKRAFNKVIRNTMMEFTFENGQVTNITYAGCPVNKGWTADNLLDVNTIKSNSYEKWGYTPAQFQQKVLSQIASIEPIITEIAKSFDCDTFISVQFDRNTYEIVVSDEDGEDVFGGAYDDYYVYNSKSILDHYNSDTVFYKVVEQMSDKTRVFEVNLLTRKVMYTEFDENYCNIGHIASFDEVGKVGMFRTCEWNTSLN